MENNNKQKSIKENILTTIKSGQLKMRPKWQFFLKAVLAIVGAVIVFLTILYLASFIIFALRQTGVLFVPIFGPEGWLAFFTHLPFFLIFLLIIFIVILELLVKHYAFAYRRPLLYSAIGIFVLAALGALIVANSPLHGGISKYADENKDSFVGKFYEDYGQPRFQDVHRGVVIETINNGFTMKNRRQEVLTIVVSRRTRLPLGADFSIGDIVVVFGPRTGNMVAAFGIQEIGGE